VYEEQRRALRAELEAKWAAEKAAVAKPPPSPAAADNEEEGADGELREAVRQLIAQQLRNNKLEKEADVKATIHEEAFEITPEEKAFLETRRKQVSDGQPVRMSELTVERVSKWTPEEYRANMAKVLAGNVTD
jgi:hypothetical protein